MAKPQGKCIFCGGNNLTKEHLWPKWLRPVVEEGIPPVRSNYQETLTYDPIKNTAVLAPSFAQAEGYPFTKRLRIACKKCNEGWMSKLEQAAKPILTDLIRGERRHLSVEDQTIIASWASSRVAVFERDQPSTAALRTEDYKHILDTQKPPPNWRFWIGHYQGNDWRLYIRHIGMGVAIEGISPPTNHNAQRTIILVGHMVINVVSAIPLIVDRVAAVFKPAQMLPVFPPEGAISWPTSFIMGDADVHTLMNMVAFRA